MSDDLSRHHEPVTDRFPRLAAPEGAARFRLRTEQVAHFREHGWVPAPLAPGEATFHHPLTVHGSFENRADRPRRAFVINAFGGGTVSDSDEPLLAGVPPIAAGERMGGRFFPLLLDRDAIVAPDRGVEEGAR